MDLMFLKMGLKKLIDSGEIAGCSITIDTMGVLELENYRYWDVIGVLYIII